MILMVGFFSFRNGRCPRSCRQFRAGDEVRDLAFSLPPQLRAGGAVMRLGICRVGILIGIKEFGVSEAMRLAVERNDQGVPGFADTGVITTSAPSAFK